MIWSIQSVLFCGNVEGFFCPLELWARLEQAGVSFRMLLILTVFSIYQPDSVQLSSSGLLVTHSGFHPYVLSLLCPFPCCGSEKLFLPWFFIWLCNIHLITDMEGPLLELTLLAFSLSQPLSRSWCILFLYSNINDEYISFSWVFVPEGLMPLTKRKFEVLVTANKKKVSLINYLKNVKTFFKNPGQIGKCNTHISTPLLLPFQFFFPCHMIFLLWESKTKISNRVLLLLM